MRSRLAIGCIIAVCSFVWLVPTSGDPDNPTVLGLDWDVASISLLLASAILAGGLVGSYRALLLVPLTFLATYALLDAIDIYLLDEYYETPTLMKLVYVGPMVFAILTPLSLLGVVAARSIERVRRMTKRNRELQST